MTRENKEKQEKVIDKIRKMLALATNNPSQEEAQTAMLLAQKLMAQHNIEMGMVQDSKPTEKEVLSDNSITDGARTQWKRKLMRIITENFRTEFLVNPYSGGFAVIGLKEDIQITISVYNYAADMLDRGMAKLRREYRKKGIPTDGISGDYAEGFLNGINDKFQEQVKHEGWGLVLVKDALVVETKKKLTGGQIGPGVSLNKSGNRQIYNEGYKQGQSCAGTKKQIN